MKYHVCKFKEGKVKQWRNWCLFLTSSKDEVLESLKEEKVSQEVCFTKNNLVYYGIDGECLKSSERKINIDHRKNVKECLERLNTYSYDVPKDAEKLFEFKV